MGDDRETVGWIIRSLDNVRWCGISFATRKEAKDKLATFLPQYRDCWRVVRLVRKRKPQPPREVWIRVDDDGNPSSVHDTYCQALAYVAEKDSRAEQEIHRYILADGGDHG